MRRSRGPGRTGPWRRAARTSSLLLGLIPVLGGGLSAQETGTVLGRVLDQETAAPVEGAFVVLLDAGDEQQNAVLSDATGRFVLRVPPGSGYRLQVERIGLATAVSDSFAVLAGQALYREIRTREAAVSLQGIEVTGSSRCSLVRETESTIRLWEEARKALEVARWVEDQGYRFESQTFERRMDRRGRRVLEETTRRTTSIGRAAFRSLDADSLALRGFIQERQDGEDSSLYYYAPDAQVLLSDAFLSTHCFRAVREEDQVGLAFEPAPGREVPEIAGTLWFGEAGALERLEYRYLEVVGQEVTQFGGEVYFERLAEGAWIVREWRIRMPQYGLRGTIAAGQLRQGLVGVREVGGQVVSVRTAEAVRSFYGASRGALRGEVLDGAGEPLAGADVYLSGTGYRTELARDGSFLLGEVLPGTYDLVLEHPALGTLGEVSWSWPVQIQADSLAVQAFPLPSGEEILVRRCEARDPIPLGDGDGDARPPGRPIIVGGMVSDAAGRAPADWPVRIRWAESRTGAGAGVAELEWSGVSVRTGSRGGWVACGLPAGVSFQVDAALEWIPEGEVARGRGRWGGTQEVSPMEPGDVIWVALQGGS